MTLSILGPSLEEIDGEVRAGGARPATLFLDGPVLVTTRPPVHCLQREAFLQRLDEQRAERGEPPLDDDQRAEYRRRSVDLFLKPGEVDIRPDPFHMELAFAGDALLEELFAKPQRRYLNVDELSVQQAMKERGELWRISVLPGTREAVDQHIADARARIDEQAVYYYNLFSGTRWLTYAEFAGLARLDAPALARQLQEIARYARRRNRLSRPEVDFFKAHGRFGQADFGDVNFLELAPRELAAHHERLRARFAEVVPADFRRDEPGVDLWRAEMYSTLVSQRAGTETEIVLAGLNPEFKQRIRWLPGGRFEQGELVFDEVFEEARRFPDDPRYAGLCDEKIKEIVFNLIREYGLLEWVNFGRIMAPSNHEAHRVTNTHASEGGRRDVYVAQLQRPGRAEPVTLFLRLQKWGVRERLDQGEELDQALLESEEYTEYILDRRLACWYLGVHVPLRLTMRRLQEPYAGKNPKFHELRLPVTYFEREYIPGFPANQLPRSRYEHAEYARRFARLLGAAAAPNLIVGRANDLSKQVVFDVGDEIVIEDEAGLPRELLVGDHAGSFVCFRESLLDLAPAYARPVNDRADKVADPVAFAKAYLDGFEERFRYVQDHYRRQQRGFDALFKHTAPPDPAGNFSFRWECVLRRLNEADPAALVRAIADRIAVLPTRA